VNKIAAKKKGGLLIRGAAVKENEFKQDLKTIRGRGGREKRARVYIRR
jgi:hypothetical protein